MKFGKEILKYKNEIIKDLAKLINIKSCAIYNPNNKDEPYGSECKKALIFVLNRAKEMGFRVKNIENYVGFVEFGDKKNHAAVLSHLDVVPADKNGWNGDPFILSSKNKRFYARGVVDNKGPAIISLYCLKALKDNNVKGNRNIRLIFGSGEECGMNDMTVYFKNESFPEMGFTPDSEYGICNVEKGILHLEISSNCKYDYIKQINAGTVINVVPDIASFIISDENKEIVEFLKNSSIRFEYKKVVDGFKIKIFGVSAHASCPEKGQNAISLMLNIFDKFLKEQTKENLLEFLEKFINKEIYGESLKISYKDNLSGPLTLNIGTLEKRGKKITAKIDIRLPVFASYEKILNNIKNKCDLFGVSLKVISYNKALSVSENSKIVKSLKKAYKEIMGKDAKLLSIGGGTYARTLKGRGVAFGPVFPPEKTGIHETNESIDIENFFLHACICLEAMKKMMES